MNSRKKYALVGFLFVSILGTLLHFVYDLTGEAVVAGIFCPINESTWEHMKLLFFPTILFGFLVFKTLREEMPFPFSSLAAGLTAGLIFIPILFYTYSGILGHTLLPVDIAIFYISVLITFYIFYKNALTGAYEKWKYLLYLVLVLFLTGFILFTFVTPNWGIFTAPQK